MNAAKKEEDIFDAARRLRDPRARADFLDSACAGEKALRSRVEDLLVAGDEADTFFSVGSTVMAAQGVPAAVEPFEGANEADQKSESVGTRVGRYKLLQKIGEGGCGVVYLAEQEEPVRRRVALKIIRLGMETRSVIARFEAERQALALMDHPNIARVFDAGATDRGLPYFVMELVSGVKITSYCDQDHLSIEQRLHLFVEICHAIQHAHQKGIIHGDIKPSNILVTRQDGTAIPKVIDFGIARATEAKLTDKALFTSFAQLIGTPAYMSPEQAEMGGVDIDTRSDIYGLGVLLYELLTGRTPFDSRALLGVGLDEMRRILREVEPPRPSARLQTLPREEWRELAQKRCTEPAKLTLLLRGDLDWIVIKALEKDRRRRYETANGFALDIQRHLHHEAVMARPPSCGYRLQKLVRRNRVVFVAGGAVAVALVIGFGTSTWLFLREREAHYRAVFAEQQQAKLRHEAEARETLTQAALLLTQQRYDEADNLTKQLEPSLPSGEGSTVYRSLGEWYALQNRWQPAAERFTTLLRVNFVESVDNSTLDCLRLGVALVELGDTSAYERFRETLPTRFSSSANPYADRVVKICLLLPASPRLLAALGPLAKEMARARDEADSSGDAFMAAWRSVALALWEYRRGNFSAALTWCQRSLSPNDYNNAPRTATARLIMAMCNHRLGRAGDAQEQYLIGRKMIENKFGSRIDLGTPIQGFWFDWGFARILMRETAALLETPSRLN